MHAEALTDHVRQGQIRQAIHVEEIRPREDGEAGAGRQAEAVASGEYEKSATPG
jgi:hypothetical protein